MKKCVAIIQARMGSSRLAGKVLHPIVGHEVLWHVVHRLRKCRELDEIRIATTTHERDNQIVDFAAREGVPVTRGSEENVLERYLLAAAESQADILIRVTGDAPLIDPVIIDVMLRKMRETSADICGGAGLDNQVIHEGFTVVSRNLLEKLARNGGHDPAVREHVIYKYDQYVPDRTCADITFDPRHFFQGARISVDTPDDAKFIETLYRKLNAAPGEIDIGDVVDLLKREPELVNINTHVRQKSAEERSHKLLIRCDGGQSVGLGHVMRCLSLAKALRDQHSVGIKFAMRAGNVPNGAIDLVHREMIPVEHLPDKGDDLAALDELVRQDDISGIVLDVRSPIGSATIERWRNWGKLCVSIDDPYERRLACDLVFYPPVPQVDDMDWQAFQGERFVGWDWVLLNPSFAQAYPKSQNDIPNIGIVMGGSDPFGLTLRSLEALRHCSNPFHAHIVLGRSNPAAGLIQDYIRDTGLPAACHIDVSNTAELFATFDMAIASFGVSAYELAATAVPSLLLSISEDHHLSASTLDQAGAAYALGLHSDVSNETLSAEINRMLGDAGMRKGMESRARALGMRNGALNIARRVRQSLDERPG